MRIAIVEDEKEYADLLCSYLRKYEKEKNYSFTIEVFSDGIHFISEYKADFDIVLMDIEMPHMDGMTTAKKLRKLDEKVCLIFVTNMARYAIKGYEVSALDFIVKPVRYFNFIQKVERAIQIRVKQQKVELILPMEDNARRLNIQDIIYIEVSNHTLIYHTTKGKISIRGTISAEEKRLRGHNFVRCNNSYLINLAKVSTVKKNMVIINNEELLISRTKKEEFLRALADFVGEK